MDRSNAGYDSVYCLTAKGRDAAIQAFGQPESPLRALDLIGRQRVEELVQDLVAGDIDIDEFVARSGLEEDDVEAVLNEVARYGSNFNFRDELQEWLEMGCPANAR